MIKPENLKIVTISFILISALLAFVVKVLFELLAVSFGLVAGFYSMDVFRHGLPLASGFATFLFFQFYKPYQTLADEVVTEVRKVVWPSQKELYSMTSLVCVILLVSGLVLGIFDLFAGTSIKFFMD